MIVFLRVGLTWKLGDMKTVRGKTGH